MSSIIEPISAEAVSFLAPYLKPKHADDGETCSNPHIITGRPFVTLTYAVSLDSNLALEPGTQTHLSGKESKSLTHYLRKRHEGILVGVGTVLADDPGLNSRIELALETEETCCQPRPIIVDPAFSWNINHDSRVLRTAREGKGLAPWVLVDEELLNSGDLAHAAQRIKILEEHGGRVIRVPKVARISPTMSGYRESWVWDWKILLEIIHADGISSLMIEGGARVINELLSGQDYLQMIDSVVITIAPVYLGKNGVNVSPAEKRVTRNGDRREEKVEAVRFKDVHWCVLGNDVVMAARPFIA